MQKRVLKTAAVFFLLSGIASAQTPKVFLDSVEARIEKITLKPDGKPSGTAPLDVE